MIGGIGEDKVGNDIIGREIRGREGRKATVLVQ